MKKKKKNTYVQYILYLSYLISYRKLKQILKAVRVQVVTTEFVAETVIFKLNDQA
jgi:hypothetical protein